jgi:hypothetical protein
LPAPVVDAGCGVEDDVLDQLRALLALLGGKCDALTFVDQPDKRWAEASIEPEESEMVAMI